ncbi:uncharacterized protein CIMG_06022 [Coccidioides immitis RS]|uniref:Uncharacterized protein n=1 Tax=Coccidioides immitis (strain RS) TaxID=246410 RepID=A0A0E1RX94_COCIM|nr:uncharacterized protein CIMG_06022 [Coccidioides immitis RS]EAS30543.2 hypothetical protein CIMG_06022 [Coccidioides immitis RS]
MAANGHSAGDGSSPGSPKELKLQPACVEPRQAELTAMHELETELGDGFQNVGRIASHQQGSPGTPDPSFDLREFRIQSPAQANLAETEGAKRVVVGHVNQAAFREILHDPTRLSFLGDT